MFKLLSFFKDLNYYIGLKNTLRNLAFAGRNFQGNRKIRLTSLDLLFPSFCLDDGGRLQQTSSIYINAFIGVDVTRIKNCKVCQNFFWANRKDRQCCSTKCGNLFNQQQSRNKKREMGFLYRKAEKNQK